MRRLNLLSVACLMAFVPVNALAQQVTFGTPTTSVSEGFFGSAGVNFGIRHSSPQGMFFFRNGGGTIPSFGGFDPNARTQFGLAGRRGDWAWNLSLSGSQGNSRSIMSTTPMLTIPNGGLGFLNNTIQRPFVIGIVPTVGQADRQRIQQQFATAAEFVRRKRAADARADAELISSRLKATSHQSKRSATPLDPPLILGASSGR